MTISDERDSEYARFRQRFITRAQSVFWVRLALIVFGLSTLFKAVQEESTIATHEALMLGVLLVFALYAVFANQLVSHKSLGRWIQFITLIVDLVCLTYFVAVTGSLHSPLLAISPIYTLLFAMLFNSPLTTAPPLFVLAIVTFLHPLTTHSRIGPDELLIIGIFGLIHGLVLYLTTYNLGQEERQTQKIIELERSLRHMAVVEERQRLSREIHDGVGGTLSALIIQSEYVLTLPDLPLKARYEVQEIKASAEEAIEELRRALVMMRGEFQFIPQLKNACANFSSRHKIPVKLSLASDKAPKLPGDVELTLFRVLQESLTNALKHAQASHIDVTLEFDHSKTRLEIKDDGVGFDTTRKHDLHYGLINMQERAKKVHGNITIDSSFQKGTRVCFQVESN